MKQITLISLWGAKRDDFPTLIAECQALVTRAVGAGFMPYELPQIHATIVGLERLPASAHNANFARHRSRHVVMDFDGFLSYLRAGGHIPFEVQIGGFNDRDYPFTSRNSPPYERSFSVQGDKVVIIGWPVRGKPLALPPASHAASIQEAWIYPRTLDLLRHGAQGFGILHAYHRAASDVDNDLFFRLGLIDPNAMSPATKSSLEDEARRFLGSRRPVVVEISLEDIFVAAYEDERLQPSSTQTYSLADPKVTGSFVAGLFR